MILDIADPTRFLPLNMTEFAVHLSCCDVWSRNVLGHLFHSGVRKMFGHLDGHSAKRSL